MCYKPGMGINDDILNGIRKGMQTAGPGAAFQAAATNAILCLVDIVRNERDARCALARQQEHRDQRVEGEIAERSQRQMEITGRLAEAERGLKTLARRVDSLDGGPGVRPADAERLDREQADAVTEAIEYARMHAWVIDAIMALQHDLANARADAQVHQSARQALEAWEAEVRTALGAHPHDSRNWMVAEIARLVAVRVAVRAFSQNSARARDLEAQVAALQKAIDDVWALVEQPDGYGSPFWTEPGIDDTTPAQAVERVLAHLRARIEYLAERALVVEQNAEENRRRYADLLAIGRNPANREAMAALNAADRQSDDDQICGC